MKFLKQLKAVFALIYIIINLTIGLFPLLVLTFVKLLLPIQTARDFIYQQMLKIYSLAVQINHFLFTRLLGVHFEVEGLEGLESDKNYLVLANHRSWTDILVLQTLLNKGAPILKFIVKKETIFIPLVGLICWAYEYPFVRRYSMKNQPTKQNEKNTDLKTINKSLGVIGRHPTTIINFVEGTRFNPLKSKKQASPFTHLLKPKAGGLTNILKTFGSKIDVILDFTIIYGCDEPVFWNFLNGTCKRIQVYVHKIPAASIIKDLSSKGDQVDYEKVSGWLYRFWQEKDQKIKDLTKY